MLRLAATTLLSIGFLGCGPGGATHAQPSTVEPGPGFTLLVDGAPFRPFGWNAVGNCPDERHEWNERDLRADLDRMRSYGLNATTEPPAADGRLIPLVLRNGYENWYSHRAVVQDGRVITLGHPRPGAYAAGLRRYMDIAFGNGRAPIYTIVSLSAFVVPHGFIPDEWGQPHGGSDVLTCAQFRETIAAERRNLTEGGETALASFVPDAVCPAPPRPYWEWNVRYVVQGLRDHPGLLGWLLWDEPEDSSHLRFFSAVDPGEPVPRYDGPESLPTPDLLHYLNELVKAAETAGMPDGYRRHPTILDIATPEFFFSRRFDWSLDGEIDPRPTPGPFDRRPDGSLGTPADVLGLEASASMGHSAARGDHPRQLWFQDQNDPVRRASLLREVVETDGLWSAFVIAGQAQLTSEGPYRIDEPTRCRGYVANPRMLNDRDLVWHLLSLQMNGMHGQIYYSHHLMPTEGLGAEQAARTNRLMQQYLTAGLDRILAGPAVDRGWGVEWIDVLDLTQYYRSDPNFLGSARNFDPGRSPGLQARGRSGPDDYVFGLFGRSEQAYAYGHATYEPASVRRGMEGYRLLRTEVRREANATYLFVSNVFDARITAGLQFGSELNGRLVEGAFDLEPDGVFAWRSDPPRARSQGPNTGRLEIDLEPYEARLFRLSP